MQAIDLCEGTVFGRLTVICLDQSTGKRLWKCQCSCGKLISTRSHNLRSGAVKSCGCLHTDHLISMNRTHGQTDSPEHKAWENMIVRCENVRSPYFKHYGGRGISVCPQWRTSFSNFLEDMGRRPSDKHSLDRINNDGNYEPSNCRWATKKQQLRNRRGNIQVTIDGVTKTISEWSEISGVGYKTLEYRVKAGWSPQDILSKPRRYSYV